MNKRPPKKCVVANWKTYPGLEEALDLFETILDPSSPFFSNPKLPITIVCPEAPLIGLGASLAEASEIQVGSQDCGYHEPGAHTGELSPRMLDELGVGYAIIGHHEKNETPEIVAQKAIAALDYEIIPIVCIGHHLTALDTILDHLKNNDADGEPIVIAYEPEDYIGAQSGAPLSTIASQCLKIRKKLSSALPESEFAILYGGSVSSKNCSELAAMDEIDGVLVGRSSTNVEEFKKILQAFTR